MKELIGAIALIVVAGIAIAADTLKGDITSQGNSSYLHKSITAQQLSATIRDYESVTSSDTLLYSECGKTLFLASQSAALDLVLPSPVAGCTFKFYVAADASDNNYTISTGAADSSANILKGGVNELETDTGQDGPYDNNADRVSFIATIAVVGDWIEMISDGTSWFFTGQTNADGAVTTSTDTGA